MDKKYCYWSIGNKEYAFFLKTLVKSARKVGVKEDFHVWSDRKIKGAVTHYMDRREASNIDEGNLFLYEFKFKYLKKMLNLNYDYYVYLDSDIYFVRKPRNPLTMLKGDPMHVFLETNLIEHKYLVRSAWWKCPTIEFIKLMRDMGVKSEKIYNINAGMLIISREYVEQMCNLAYKFWIYAQKKGYNFMDEPPICYAMHMLCSDTEKHLLKDNLDFYAPYASSYKLSNFEKKFPNGRPWTLEIFFTGQKILVNPAIVHFILYKEHLLGFNGRLFRKVNYLFNKMKNYKFFRFLKSYFH